MFRRSPRLQCYILEVGLSDPDLLQGTRKGCHFESPFSSRCKVAGRHSGGGSSGPWFCSRLHVQTPFRQDPGRQGCSLEVDLLDADCVQGGKKDAMLKAVFVKVHMSRGRLESQSGR